MVTIDPAARANVTLIDHPLVQHKLTLMRNKDRQHQQLSPSAQ